MFNTAEFYDYRPGFVNAAGALISTPDGLVRFFYLVRPLRTVFFLLFHNGNRGFSSSLNTHADIALQYFGVLLMMSAFVLPVAFVVCILIRRCQGVLFGLGVFALSSRLLRCQDAGAAGIPVLVLGLMFPHLYRIYFPPGVGPMYSVATTILSKYTTFFSFLVHRSVT
jgi:hypothetical protein